MLFRLESRIDAPDAARLERRFGIFLAQKRGSCGHENPL